MFRVLAYDYYIYSPYSYATLTHTILQVPAATPLTAINCKTEHNIDGEDKEKFFSVSPCLHAYSWYLYSK